MDPVFKSGNLQYVKQFSIVHTSSPSNSQANRKVEPAVKTAKRVMRKCKESGYIYMTILDHRNT